ncbi:Signal recognition particle associated protein [Lachnospiraceae bacterium TWA4]|nr:Signal recognition particle associated protein [Lachnospiraceae bacterium TWA4]
MEELLEQTLLYDFYGELLTDRQKKVYEDVVFNDYSYSEVAKEQGISRQGVYDMVKRIHNTLEGYEEKLHLVEQFVETKEKVSKINELAGEFFKTGDSSCITKIQQIASKIID